MHRGHVWHAKGDVGRAVADFTRAARLQTDLKRHFRWLHLATPERQPILAKLLGPLPDGVGDNVVVAERAEIRRDGQVLDTVGRGTVLIAYGQEEDGLRVRYRRRGVIARKDALTLDEAIDHFTHAIEREPDDAGAHRSRGNAWTFKHDHDKALADLDRAVLLDSKDAAAYHQRGIAWAYKGVPDRATADFDEAVRLAPGDPTAYNDRVVQSMQMGDQQAAITDLVETVRLDPEYAMAYRNLGGARFLLGDIASALDELDVAFRLDPGDPATLMFRASCWENSEGPTDRWAADVASAVEIDPRHVRLSLGFPA
jgi:tetratricopeptide (TPR) repeat protein